MLYVQSFKYQLLSTLSLQLDCSMKVNMILDNCVNIHLYFTIDRHYCGVGDSCLRNQHFMALKHCVIMKATTRKPLNYTRNKNSHLVIH